MSGISHLVCCVKLSNEVPSKTTLMSEGTGEEKVEAESMRSTSPKRVRLSRPLVIAIGLAVVAAVAITGITLASSGPDTQKQNAFATVTAAQATAQAGYRAPKPAATTQLPASCPTSFSQTGILPWGGPGVTPFKSNATFTTQAGMISSAGDDYVIYAGALIADPQQGVLYVLEENRDPCAVARGVAPDHSGQRVYPSPARGGALTLTQIVGDTVAYSVADGTAGGFNYVTGQYLSA